MQAGKLDQRVQFFRKVVASQNTYGEDVLAAPTNLGTFWCAVYYLAGRELEAARQRWAEARYKITLRRQPGVTLKPSDYAVWATKTLDILDVQNIDTRDDRWVLLAKDYVE